MTTLFKTMGALVALCTFLGWAGGSALGGFVAGMVLAGAVVWTLGDDA